jgi:ascorbate-specific PTS system EIIC-type component UlaA
MEIWTKIYDWFESTHLHEQIKGVDYIGLFTNPWFYVPFGLMIVYMIVKQKWKDIIIVAIFVGVWWVSGTAYMDTLIVRGEIQIEKILPVIFGGAGAMGVVIYLLFGRSD